MDRPPEWGEYKYDPKLYRKDGKPLALRKDGRPRKKKVKHRVITDAKLVLHCSVEGCVYQCRFVSLMEIHCRKHSGEKAYRCDSCGHECSQKANMKTHVRSKHLEVSGMSAAAVEETMATFEPTMLETPFAARWAAAVGALYKLECSAADEEDAEARAAAAAAIPDARKEVAEAMAAGVEHGNTIKAQIEAEKKANSAKLKAARQARRKRERAEERRKLEDAGLTKAAIRKRKSAAKQQAKAEAEERTRKAKEVLRAATKKRSRTASASAASASREQKRQKTSDAALFGAALGALPPPIPDAVADSMLTSHSATRRRSRTKADFEFDAFLTAFSKPLPRLSSTAPPTRATPAALTPSPPRTTLLPTNLSLHPSAPRTAFTVVHTDPGTPRLPASLPSFVASSVVHAVPPAAAGEAPASPRAARPPLPAATE